MSTGFVGVSITDGDLLNGIATHCGARLLGFRSQSTKLPDATNTVICVEGAITAQDQYGVVTITQGITQ